ncbi:hypothetical protein [Streptomyces nigra]|uniref:hypothetical protein n=1 Tax=Streptomyces nigra TaxID=1827580 RepID=UPI00341F5341
MVLRRIPEGAVLRVLALIVATSVYLALHWLISTGISLHERHLLREAPRHADAVVAAALQLRSVAQPGGTAMTAAEEAALDEIDQGMRWLDHAAPTDGYRIDSSTDLWSLEDWRSFRRTGVVPPQDGADPCEGRASAENPNKLPPLAQNVDPLCDLAFTVDSLTDLPVDVAQEQKRVGADVTRYFRAFLKCVAVAFPFFLAWLVLVRRRRRRNASAVADVVRMARELTPAGPWWYRLVHITLTAIGFVFLYVGVLGGTAGFAAWGLGTNFALRGALLVGGVVLAKSGSLILRYARPRSRADPILALAHSGRAPVLYLRSFADDTDAADKGEIPLGGLMRFTEIESREELFATVVGGFGPMVAVGRPGERLPPLGAVRLYFPSDTWRSAVARLMGRSRLVIIRLGEGRELWWEFDHAVAHIPPGKVLALLPGGPSLPALIERLDASLPAPSGAAEAVRRSGNAWTSAVLSFDPMWRAQVFPVGPLAGQKRRLSPAHEVARALQLALAAVGVHRRGLGLRMNMVRVALLGKVLLTFPLLVLLVRVLELTVELRR